ncbi:MAG TPA: PAS domain S-box protein [Fimbriiglobus sp.]|nr:PAS domain S-box protein [Fimbriiglobus sp.]
MDPKQPVPDETQTLRRCVRELAALSTLSAVWSRSDPREVAEGLCRVLSSSLPAALVYIRINGHCGTVAVEVAGTQRGPIQSDQTREIGTTLEPLLGSGSHDQTPAIADPFGGGTLRLAINQLGYGGDCGVLVAGSHQPDFPGQTDRLLLGVAANQAAVVLQQKRAEEQIRRREQELSDFFDNATVGLHWVGPDGTILRANRAELDLLGYPPDEYIGRHIAEFHADRDVIEDVLRRLRAGETVRDREARMRCKDGSIRHVLIDSSVLWENGRFVHTRCFTRDITERKLVEETRLRLAAIVESSDDAIIGIDLNGTITSWNRAAERLYGYTAEEVVGRPTSVLIPPDHKDDFPTIMGRLGRGERIERYETVRVSKGGRRVDVSLTISPVRNAEGRVVGASKIAHDVTDRKRTGAALRRQTERLRLLWEAAAVLLTADNPDAMLRGLLGKIGPHLGVDTYFNFTVTDGGDALRLASCEGIPVEAARTITRLEFGQAVCGTVALHRRPIVATHIQQSDDPKVQLVKSFGLRAYACNPLLAGDRLLGTLSFASHTRDEFDPDEVAFMETVCHYATVAYERLRLVNELKEADRRKDEFLATLAHELRNPLAPVRNAVQVLRHKGPDDPELRWGRDVIDRQVEHLTRLIDDLMDISRITRNKLELRKQRVELAEVITGAVESSRPAVEQCGHELTVTLPPQPIYLNGDLVRLAQVFQNLLTNAVKYTERGGQIWLTAERQGGDAVVRVKDTGVGIPGEKLPRLFEMFFQVDRTLERSQGGLGIGLSLVRRLVELHGGRVDARSEGVGKGSEFIVRLPVLVEKSIPPQSQEPGGNGRTKTTARRILVVDDNRDSADSLAMLLRLTGHEVHAAYDGVEGVEAAERVRPEVVLLDIGMPGLNGYDACRRIRGQEWGKDVMLIATTGWGQDEDRRRTGEAGFDAHLVKPVDPQALMRLLAGLQVVRP